MMPDVTTPDQKIALAKQLLIQATIQRQRELAASLAADLCRCGHRRDAHTETWSVNYTQGFCMRAGCECRWFHYQEQKMHQEGAKAGRAGT